MATTAWADPPPLRARTDRYTRVAIVLHWVIAAAIIYNLTSGLLRDQLPRGFFALHISSGLTILILSVVRVVWKLMHKGLPFLPMAGWERWLARITHFLLYAAMLFVPWTGWVMISANPPAGSAGAAYAQAQSAQAATAAGKPAPVPRKPSLFWGLVEVPKIGPVADLGREPAGVAEQRAFHEQMEETHGTVAIMLLFLLVLHVGGALKHQFVDRQPELARMGIGRGRGGSG
ncbi:cytochrome b [Sphingomonas sp.]|jgi:cytochrome b561|uniref:cytochrome b n=1 Tax=Sphingomonas sp. TaxID=28214 RepID=UPI002D7F480E|nr:cytochrome b/b6 domain-containing protein [Sphingomonas sp.]HEU0043626.1 cytochrome b/b6 domain-containing protein [Sphingomonas sp.]